MSLVIHESPHRARGGGGLALETSASRAANHPSFSEDWEALAEDVHANFLATEYPAHGNAPLRIICQCCVSTEICQGR